MKRINVELKMKFGHNEVELVTNMPQEDIYHIMDLYNEGSLHKLKRIGRGSYGSVYGYKDFAIKEFHDSSDELNRDIDVLKSLKHLDCIPTLYAVIDNSVVIMERVYGKTIRQYCHNGEDNNNEYGIDESFIEKWENALLEVVKAGYSPDDLHESNVMIDERTIEPKLVDVGWFFKHNSNYDNFDIHKMKTDYGYSRAQMWTGDALKSYIRRERRRLEREAEKVLDRNRNAVEQFKAV